MHSFSGSHPTMALTGAVEPVPAAPEPRSELASLWRILVRRRAIVWRVFALFVALMFVGTLVWPKSYTSTIKVIAGNSGGAAASSATSGSTDLPVLNALVIANGMQSSETYAELFKETPVLQGVIDQLKLKTSPHGLLEHVTVEPITNTNILSISASWNTREQSAAIANAFGTAIMNRQRELVSSQATTAIASLKDQLPQARDRMNQADNRLASFEAQHRIANIDEQTQGMISTIAGVESKIGSLQADREEAQAQLSSASRQMGGMSPTITGNTTVSENPVVAQLRVQLAQVQTQLQQDEQQYTDQYPVVSRSKRSRSSSKRRSQKSSRPSSREPIKFPTPSISSSRSRPRPIAARSPPIRRRSPSSRVSAPRSSRSSRSCRVRPRNWPICSATQRLQRTSTPRCNPNLSTPKSPRKRRSRT